MLWFSINRNLSSLLSLLLTCLLLAKSPVWIMLWSRKLSPRIWIKLKLKLIICCYNIDSVSFVFKLFINVLLDTLLHFLFLNSIHMYWNRFHQQIPNAGLHQKHPGMFHVTTTCIFVGFLVLNNFSNGIGAEDGWQNLLDPSTFCAVVTIITIPAALCWLLSLKYEFCILDNLSFTLTVV